MSRLQCQITLACNFLHNIVAIMQHTENKIHSQYMKIFPTNIWKQASEPQKGIEKCHKELSFVRPHIQVEHNHISSPSNFLFSWQSCVTSLFVWPCREFLWSKPFSYTETQDVFSYKKVKMHWGRGSQFSKKDRILGSGIKCIKHKGIIDPANTMPSSDYSLVYNLDNALIVNAPGR